ncbi:MAG TPA: Gfo/Idh/MocA family oxidoreductase [Pirellulaceae bacterium]|nr:Gfo/Idh/MocA family oxidoreductase [Pirellulaceae bacterium]
MATRQTLRIGIVGLGANTRLRHVPGLRACEGVEIVAVSNRRPESTQAAAREFGIPRTFEHWQDLVAAPDIDAIVIGTWPYLHCPIACAALAAGKHVMTEARMALNADEARQMLAASRARPDLVAQIVPSPFGFHADRVVRRLLADGYIGQLREVLVIGASDVFADASTPLHWRQIGELSGVNMLTLGILHETVMRWVPDPVRVFAQGAAFTPERIDSVSGLRRQVGTPDSVQVLTEIEGGARGIYHFSGVTRFGLGSQIHLYGSDGTLRYELAPQERLLGARRGDPQLAEIAVPVEQRLKWRVEEEFVNAIRGLERIEFTDFETGVRYMEFTEAVAHSIASGEPVSLGSEASGD